MINFAVDQFSVDLFFRLLVAAGLGAVIGFERDIHGRAAGLRTNILVSLGAALYMLISLAMLNVELPANLPITITADPGRIAAQIITGIGFLGAGAIIKEGFTVRGLTTAAGLWLVAGVGMTAGAGLYYMAALATLIGLIALVALNQIERLYAKDTYHTLELVTTSDVTLPEIMEIFAKRSLKVRSLKYEIDHDHQLIHGSFSIRIFEKRPQISLYQDLINEFEHSRLKIKRIKWSS
jgi:putative Mg2+ transporter-C (MgtC) family protein